MQSVLTNSSVVRPVGSRGLPATAVRVSTGKHASLRRSLTLVAALILATVAAGCQSEGSDPDPNITLQPVASFSQDVSAGAPASAGPPATAGTSVTFTDTSINATSRLWDFGPLGTRTDANPTILYTAAGVYDVTLTVSNASGSSTVSRPGAVTVATPPTTGFSCTPTIGLSGMLVTCTDTSTDATSVMWDYGDGTVTTSPTHIYSINDGGPDQAFTISQTVSGPGGSATSPAIDNIVVNVAPFRINASAITGTAPLDVTLSVNEEAIANAFDPGFLGLPVTVTWRVNGAVVETQILMGTFPLPTAETSQRFSTPGSYVVEVEIAHPNGQNGIRSLTPIIVGYSPASPAFTPDQTVGSGPFEVVFTDDSSGAIDQWIWEFEPGASAGLGDCCAFPALSSPLTTPPGTCPVSPPTCNAQSPTHIFEDVGRYNVRLTVEGPDAMGNPAAVRITSPSDPEAIVVALRDGSFERQSPAAPLSGDWVGLPMAGVGSADDHTALRTMPGAADGGMPTEGNFWAVLDGQSTDGSVPPEDTVNGIVQGGILMPTNAPVLEFDFALLYNEPPGAAVPMLPELADSVVAVIRDNAGSPAVVIPSSRATASDPYTGESLRFPTRDGSPVRVTPVYTGSVNLATEFPTATTATRFTLSFHVANDGGNNFRSPRAYIDNVRFVPVAAPISSEFYVFDPDTNAFLTPAGGIVTLEQGQSVRFVDGTCLLADATGPGGACASMCAVGDIGNDTCSVAENRRWDFATNGLATPPPASGSNLAEPLYTFTGGGSFEVELIARASDQESSSTLTIDVIGAPVARFDILMGAGDPTPPYAAGDTLRFDASASAPGAMDSGIMSYDWDFGGFGTANGVGPHSVTFPQTGTFTITLTVTGDSGLTTTVQQTVTFN